MEIISEMYNFFNCCIHCWMPLAEAPDSHAAVGRWWHISAMQDFGIAGVWPQRESTMRKMSPQDPVHSSQHWFCQSLGGFPFPGAQPGSSEMMMLVHCGTMRILSQHCVQLRWTERSATSCEQRQQRRAPARLQGTHRDAPVRLTENHRLNFFALLSKEKLPAPSPRLWDETVELWTGWCSFQQNPGGRKIKQNSFPRWMTVKEWPAPGKTPKIC